MAVITKTATFIECDFESDLSLSFGGTAIIHTLDTDKYWKVMRNTFVETTINAIPYISKPQTYSASISAFVCAAAATDVFTIGGSATKVIKITKITVTGTTTAGSGASISLTLPIRSTANTLGTFITLINVPYDSTNSLSTAVVKRYTVNPTLGTLVGNIHAQRVSINTVGTLNNEFSMEYSVRDSQPVILRGVNQSLCVNFGGATITGSLISISVEWTES
jgi:hypothetical protein